MQGQEATVVAADVNTFSSVFSPGEVFCIV